MAYTLLAIASAAAFAPHAQLRASALVPNAPQQLRPPLALRAGFGSTKTATKAVQLKGGPKPMDKQWDQSLSRRGMPRNRGDAAARPRRGPGRGDVAAAGSSAITREGQRQSHDVAPTASPRPRRRDRARRYFVLKEAGGEVKEVWLTTPGGEKPLPLGFVAYKAGASAAEAVALQKALILWCAEGLHPKLAPFLRGKMKDGEAKLDVAFCDVAKMTDEEIKAEEEAGDAVVDGKPPGGPLTELGSTRAPPTLAPKDVGFMPFKSPIEAGQAAMRKPMKRETSSGVAQS